MVVACIALGIALGGTSVAAINALPKNSVGTKQLKKNAVTSPKVKNNAITGADVNEGTLGTVPSATNATNAANAANATSATNATNATNAVSAQTAQTLTPAESFRNIGTAGNPGFQGTWTNFGSGRATAGFFRDQQNIVYLKGSITGGTSGTVAFTLPAGYRPASTLLLPVTSGSFLTVTATLDSNGGLAPFCSGGCSGSIGLDGLSFRVGTGGAAPSLGPTGDTPDG
jgi:hypothetical protein